MARLAEGDDPARASKSDESIKIGDQPASQGRCTAFN
jgi:hypothetical protein